MSDKRKGAETIMGWEKGGVGGGPFIILFGWCYGCIVAVYLS